MPLRTRSRNSLLERLCKAPACTIVQDTDRLDPHAGGRTVWGIFMATSGKVTRYVRFARAGMVSYGILEADMVGELEGSIFEDAALTGREFPMSQARILVPCEPSQVLAVALNYPTHRMPHASS